MTRQKHTMVETLLAKLQEEQPKPEPEPKPESKPVTKPQADKNTTPKTGDTEPIMMWMILTAAGAAGIVTCVIRKRKKQNMN